MQVYLYGAVVASWTQPSGDEVLYVRPDAKFDKSKPISGGIPHCFPQVLPFETFTCCLTSKVHPHNARLDPVFHGFCSLDRGQRCSSMALRAI